MNWSPPPRCGRAAEAPLINASLLQLFHNVLVEIEIHLSLLCALNTSNSKTVPNFVGRDTTEHVTYQACGGLDQWFIVVTTTTIVLRTHSSCRAPSCDTRNAAGSPLAHTTTNDVGVLLGQTRRVQRVRGQPKAYADNEP